MKKIVISLCMLVAIVVTPLVSHASTLADGKYSLPFQVNKGGSTSASYGNDYFVKPAILVIKNGQMYVQFTVKNSTWINTLNGSEGGNQVISTNAATDTRVVQFNVSDPFGKTAADMKVDIDELSYHHEYSVDFVWFGDKATLIESYVAPEVEQEKPQTSIATSQAPSTNSQPKQKTEQTEQNPPETKQAIEADKKEETVAVAETKQKAKEENENFNAEVTNEKENDQASEDQEDEVVAAEVKQVDETTKQAIEVSNESSSNNATWIILSIVVVILLAGGFIVVRKKSKVE